jgi:hypothetical protein
MNETIVNALISGIFSLIGVWLKYRLDYGGGCRRVWDTWESNFFY